MLTTVVVVLACSEGPPPRAAQARVPAAERSEQLLRAFILESLAERSQGTASERVRRLAKSYLGPAPGQSEAFEALVGAGCHGDAELARWVRAIFARFEVLLVAIIREGIRHREPSCLALLESRRRV